MKERKLIGLALVQHEKGGRPFLFQVPLGVSLAVGDTVSYETEFDHIAMGTVLAVCTTWRGGEEYNLALATSGQSDPLPKLKSRFKTVDIYYESEE